MRVLSILIFVLTPGLALAVHECGTPHPAHPGAQARGCEALAESDFFNGDLRSDAPQLAGRGSYPVGVRSLELVNPDQLDILSYSEKNPNPRYDRPLTLEIWYPANLAAGERQITTYTDVLGHGADNPARPNLPFEFGGRAARGAQARSVDGPYPLVIVSHGYSGSRVLLTWLTENLASKGYVVVAIDHTESTHGDTGSIHSTMIHRPRDITFVLDAVAVLGETPGSFLEGRINADRTAVIGYSMGTYGALSAAGVGVSEVAVDYPDLAPPGGHLAALQMGNPDYKAQLDDRIKVLVAFAPFAPPGFWAMQGIEKLSIPSLFIVGSEDQTTTYAAAKWLYDKAINSPRYLLVFQGALHQIAANPAPAVANSHFREYVHYQEPAWDNRRLNNINQHFITAFLGKYLTGAQEQYAEYLELLPISNQSPRTDTSHPDYWKGFKNWSAIGMELHHSPGGN
jgi:predicted dienelactone hydrolase